MRGRKGGGDEGDVVYDYRDEDTVYESIVCNYCILQIHWMEKSYSIFVNTYTAKE